MFNKVCMFINLLKIFPPAIVANLKTKKTFYLYIDFPILRLQNVDDVISLAPEATDAFKTW